MIDTVLNVLLETVCVTQQEYYVLTMYSALIQLTMGCYLEL